MRLKVLASSSKGNCYIFDNGSEALVLECGVKFDDILRAIDFDTKRVVALLISHEHGDHSKSYREAEKYKIPLYMSTGTSEALAVKDNAFLTKMQEKKHYQAGGFRFFGFRAEHDAKEPFGFLLYHKEMGQVLFLTDSYFVRYRFEGLRHMLVECNYIDEILEENLEAGIITPVQRNRVIKSHMSLDTCKEFISANDTKALQSIVLLHLSPTNSDASQMKKEIISHSGKRVFVAERGLEVELEKTIF